jgi:hypothetical protein
MPTKIEEIEKLREAVIKKHFPHLNNPVFCNYVPVGGVSCNSLIRRFTEARSTY